MECKNLYYRYWKSYLKVILENYYYESKNILILFIERNNFSQRR